MQYMTVLDTIGGLDRFFVQQKFTPLVNRYRVSMLAADGNSEGAPLVQVQQKRLKIREQIDIFGDDGRNELVLQLKAKSVFEMRGRSEVRLADGTLIGQLQKEFGKSLLRSTWEILDPAGRIVATAEESSMFIAILRRVWGQIPVVGAVPFMLPFHFDISVDGRPVGSYRRIWSLLDRYVMDLSGDTEKRVDRRVAVAFAIALDALQSR